MLFKSARGQESPQRLPNLFCDDPIRPDKARLAAWAIALGQPRTAPPRRRPHRGMLPDVDFARLQPAPRRPTLVLRLWRWFSRRRASDAAPPATALSTASGKALGNSVQAPYLEWIARDWEPAVEDVPYGQPSQRPAA